MGCEAGRAVLPLCTKLRYKAKNKTLNAKKFSTLDKRVFINWIYWFPTSKIKTTFLKNNQ
jgi:hypothetical protein